MGRHDAAAPVVEGPVEGPVEGVLPCGPNHPLPLGVLKAKTIKFSPPLPEWKRAAIDRLGFGPIEKVRAPPY